MYYRILKKGQVCFPGILYSNKQSVLSRISTLQESAKVNVSLVSSKGLRQDEYSFEEINPEVDGFWIESSREKGLICNYYGKRHAVVKNFGRWFLLDDDSLVCALPNGSPYIVNVSDLSDNVFLIDHVLNKPADAFDIGSFAKVLIHLIQTRRIPDIQKIFLIDV